MKMFIETFVTVFLVSMTILICVMFIGVQMQTNQAKEMHTEYVSKIENSDLDSTVISECIADATSKGFELSITGICDGDGSNPEIHEKKLCGNCNAVMNKKDAAGNEVFKCPQCNSTKLKNYKTDKFCLVTLKYHIKVSVLNLEREGTINGYAR